MGNPKIYLVLPLIVWFVSCAETVSELERALILSGENRIELEKVLTHYKELERDSLKLKAAIFLIENMPGHYSWYGEVLDEYHEKVEQDEQMKMLPWHLRNIFHYYPYNGTYKIPGAKKIEDIHCIKADFLIRNIDRAFECWDKLWAKHFGFEDFCEYMLPYRVDNEPLSNWRDSLDGTFSELVSRIEDIDELFDSPYQLCTLINDHLISALKRARENDVEFHHPLIGTKSIHELGCPEYVYGVIFPMRSLGIPVSIEVIEQWSTRSGKHFWNAAYHYTGLHYPFTGFESRPRGLNQNYKINKVYRKTYAQNKSALPFDYPEEDIPPFFRNIFLKDVTSQYMTTHDVCIPLETSLLVDEKYAYLCVFNNENWIPVDWGRIVNGAVAFKEIGPQTMFVAGVYYDQEMIPVSHPFSLNLDGEVRYVIPDTTNTTMHLKRKYPLLNRFANYSRNLIGAVIEGADRADFSTTQKVAEITRDAETRLDSLLITDERSYRYYQLKSRRKMELAEIEFYGTQGQRLPVSNILIPAGGIHPPGTEYKVVNGSYADFTEIESWIGFDMGTEVRLSKIRFQPRTDDNHISKGDLYELFIFRDYEFKSLRRVKAEEHFLTLDEIPRNGLYLLKNRTKGREHRIFTYENDKVIFW